MDIARANLLSEGFVVWAPVPSLVRCSWGLFILVDKVNNKQFFFSV